MRLATITAIIAGLALATVTYAQTISFDFDRAANFRGYKTYAWVTGTPVRDPFAHQRVMSAVDSQLAAKGLSKVASAEANPDVLVAYHASFDQDLQINGFGSGWGGYRFAGARSGSARVEAIVVGTMIVDIVDPKVDTIVWRGTATRDIDVHAKPEQRDKNITKAAEKLFKNYPPTK